MMVEVEDLRLVPVWVILIAPFLGSYIGTLVARSTDLHSSLVDRSRCDHCGHKLAWFELIPIVSWIVQRRRCRHCQYPLSLFYPLVEIAAATPVLWATVTGMPDWRLVASAVLGWFLITLGLIDWRIRRLPNPITLGLFIGGVLFAALFEPEQFLGRLVGAVAGFSALALISIAYRELRKRDGLGLGDAKLVGALGMWVHWQELPLLLLFASLLGIIYVLVKSWGRQSLDMAERIPFGPFLAAAGWITWLYEPVQRLSALLP